MRPAMTVSSEELLCGGQSVSPVSLACGTWVATCSSDPDSDGGEVTGTEVLLSDSEPRVPTEGMAGYAALCGG